MHAGRAGAGYGVHLMDAALETGAPAMLGDGRGLLVTTPTVQRLYGGRIERAVAAAEGRLDVLEISGGERRKHMRSLSAIEARALEVGLERDATFVALGGGVCSDLVTLAASLYRRGVRHVRVPTTLVGQIDAGIGAKGAVNFAGRKNAIGCFHAPSAVLIDPSFLHTLDPGEIRAGLAEIVKMALVSDRELFELVASTHEQLIDSRFRHPADAGRRIIEIAARRMLEALSENLFEEQGYERTVDGGHTFSPGLEAAGGFSIRHGEAVSVDLALSATLATELGILDPRDRDTIVETLRAIGLPVTSPLLTPAMCSAALDDAERHRGGRINLPLPVCIGEVAFIASKSDVPAAAIRRALARLAREGGGVASGPRLIGVR